MIVRRSRMNPCWILSYARSGSTFFRDLMNATGLFSHNGFAEKFHLSHSKHKIRSEFDKNPLYFKYVKVLRDHFEDKFNDNEKLYIEKRLPNIKYIRLRRKNMFEVAVSLYFAEYTNTWFVKDDRQKNRFMEIKIPYDEKRLVECYNRCQGWYSSWDNYLDGVNFFNIEYEDFISSPKNTFEKSLIYLGIRLKNEDIDKIVNLHSHKKMKRPESDELVEKLKILIK